MYKKSEIQNKPVSLKLTRQTVVALTADALGHVAGGRSGVTVLSCVPTVQCPSK
jgi:hypothetical protein